MGTISQRNKCVGLLMGAFKDITPQRAAVYTEFLKDIPDELLMPAVRNVIMTCKFAPSVAEIREEAMRLRDSVSGKDAPDAGRAWGDALKAVSSVGYYRRPKFDDPITQEAVERFGWQELCSQPTDTISVARAQFMKIYNECAKRHKEQDRAAQTMQVNGVQSLVHKVAGALPMGE